MATWMKLEEDIMLSKITQGEQVLDGLTPLWNIERQNKRIDSIDNDQL